MSALDRFRSYTPRQQWMLVGGFLAITCVSLALIWFLLIRTTYVAAFEHLRAADAATIVADLEKKKVPYQLSDGGATILVPSGAVESTRLDVTTEDLPLKGTVGFELFNKSDMGLTDFAQRINYQRALQGELERTIMSLDGIESARVHLSLGEDRIFRDDRVPPKASVTLRMRDQARLSSATAQGIQRLVAAAVPNLESGAVVIIDEKGGLIGTPAAEPARGMLPPALQEERGIEEYYGARITDAVRQAVPQLSPAIRVVAELGNADRSSLVDWTPAARTFPLHVTVEGKVDAPQQELVRNAVQGAIGTVAGVTDTTEFVPPQGRLGLERSVIANTAKPAPVSVPDAKLAAEDDGGSWGPFTVGLIIFAGLLLLILAGLSRIRPRGRLSDRQRQNFVLRLRSVLTDGSAHAAGS